MIGFVGLGTMGGPCALHLARAGPLLVWDTRADSPGVRAAVESGAIAASSLSELGRCSMLVLCLPDGSAVEAVTSALSGSLHRDAIVVDCSTTSPGTARSVADNLGCRFVDAPVTGERARAESGTLTSMVGADHERDFESAAPILACFASTVLHVGRLGHGQLAKALNNCLYNCSVAAMAEVLPLATRAGLDLDAFCKVVGVRGRKSNPVPAAAQSRVYPRGTGSLTTRRRTRAAGGHRPELRLRQVRAAGAHTPVRGAATRLPDGRGVQGHGGSRRGGLARRRRARHGWRSAAHVYVPSHPPPTSCASSSPLLLAPSSPPPHLHLAPRPTPSFSDEDALRAGLAGQHKGAMVKVWEARLGVTVGDGPSAVGRPRAKL